MINLEFQCSFIPNYLPYSQRNWNHYIDQQESDSYIPDQFYPKNIKQPIIIQPNDRKQPYNPNQYPHNNFAIHNNINPQNITIVQKQPIPNENTYTLNKDNNKKLTFGLTKYKDIKSALANSNHQKNHIKVKIKKNNQHHQSHHQCTFAPKTNNYRQPPYKNFKQFTNFQQQFINKKQAKLKKIKKQITQTQANNNLNSQPPKKQPLKKNFRRLSLITQPNTLIKKNQMKSHDQFQPSPKQTTTQPQQLTPKLQIKPKLHGNCPNKIQTISAKTTNRRKGLQSLVENQFIKHQQTHRKVQSSFPTPDKQNKPNNKNIFTKIRQQFLQLLQIDNQDQLPSNSNHIPPILVLTILSQLFNIQLDPNKNQYLCLSIINYLIPSHSDQQQYNNIYISIHKFWDFIKAIIIGNKGSSNQISSFTSQEISNIHQSLGYFYFQRLLKQHQPIKKQIPNPSSQLPISLIQHPNPSPPKFPTKMPHKHKHQKSNKNILQQINDKQQILQDLSILNQIYRTPELQKQYVQPKQTKPKIKKSIHKLSNKKIQNKIKMAFNSPISSYKYDSIEKAKKIVNKINSIKKKLSAPQKHIHKQLIQLTQNKIPQNDPTKDSLKTAPDNPRTSLQCSLAQTIKEVQANARTKVYRAESATLLKEIQQQKKQILGELSNFLGYSWNNHSKQKQQKFPNLKDNNQQR